MQEIDSLSTDFSTPIVKGKEAGWRIRAKLAVRGSKIGLFSPGTHEVEDLIDCPDHHPSINKALHLLRKAPYTPYNEQTLTGDLRYVQLTVQRFSGKVQLVLVSNGKGKCDALVEKLKSEEWHSIWVNVQQGSTNTIFGKEWELKMGPTYLEEKILGKSFYFHPACFVQANLDLFEQILLDIKSWILPNQQLTEFYAGIGVISLTLADHCKSATLVEINPFAEKCFRQNGPPSHFKFFTGPTENYLDKMQDVLVVDPPRKGLDPKVLEGLRDTSLKQILYLSCNVETLKRDLEVLKSYGWKIRQAKGYHLFPNTQYIELLVDLRKTISR
ncbi:MAG: class I SAM-dependent RNA methyltransferase [Verrucomicrobia bacterium]|nr:class I SAM-dependent RNA methyltransferase [Verrucomicrobiota bacterium]